MPQRQIFILGQQADQSSVAATINPPSPEVKVTGDPASILAAALAQRKGKVMQIGIPSSVEIFINRQMTNTRKMFGIKYVFGAL